VYEHAARLAEGMGHEERAMLLYEKAGLFDQAATLAERLGRGEAAQRYRLIASL